MPLVTMMLTGRLGNLLFQYAYLRAYAEQNGYEICLPPWIGERVFQIPQAIRHSHPDKDLGEDLCQRQDCLIYTRTQVRKWFRFRQDMLDKLRIAKCSCFAVLNIRQAEDYLRAGMVCLGIQCYEDEYKTRFHESSEDRHIYEMDTMPLRYPEFTGDPNGSGLHTSEVCLPSFYRLMTAPILFRANSTFSWWAATLGNGRVFSPVIEGMKGGVPDQYCDNFVEGNWPRMSQDSCCTDLHLKEN